MVCLSANDLRPELRDFCNSEGIGLHEADTGVNVEPFVLASTDEIEHVLALLADPLRQPAMFFCTTGKLVTSLFTGCYRRRSGWNLVSIIHEFEMYSGDQGTLLDHQFLEDFSPETTT
jgi:protein tyrosine/serine phosphatase